MRFLIQRVSEAKVTVDNEVIGEIGDGFCVLIGIAETDTEEIADVLIKKMTGLRIFQSTQTAEKATGRPSSRPAHPNMPIGCMSTS